MISLVIKKRLDAKPGDETEREYITTDELDAEGDEITVHKAEYPEAFPVPDVLVCGSFLTWGQVDALRNAIDAAEKRWRLTEKEQSIKEQEFRFRVVQYQGIVYKMISDIVDGDVILNPKYKKFVLVDEARYRKLIRGADE